MNAPVTRRALLGASAAAVGAVALPIAASALASPATRDAELLRLLDAWGSARAAADVAGERANALWDAFVDLEPERPAALHFSGADGLNCGFEVEVLPNGRRRVFYGLTEIGKVMSGPLPTRNVWQGEPAPWGNGEEVGRWVAVPNEQAIERRAEVIAAHHAWIAEGRVIKERLGMDAADEAEEDAVTALFEIEGAILGTVPATAAGLLAKARWATRPGLPTALAAEWTQRVAADVVAMAERGGVAS